MLHRNAEGYFDPTAGSALKNILESENKKMNDFEINNGDIFEVELANRNTGFFVILSAHEDVSSVLRLTEYDDQPFKVVCQGMKYTNPDMIQYIFNSKIVNFVRRMTEDEYKELMDSVMDSLGYIPTMKQHEAQVQTVQVHEVKNDADSEEIVKVKAERDIYKNLYENLIGSMIKR